LPYRRALAVAKKCEGSDAAPELVAEALAQALWEAPAGRAQDRPWARELAVQTRDSFRAATGKAVQFTQAESWITAQW